MPQEDVHLHYDEQIATETYVLRNYAHLLTEEERAILDNGLQAWWEENLERMIGITSLVRVRAMPGADSGPC